MHTDPHQELSRVKERLQDLERTLRSTKPKERTLTFKVQSEERIFERKKAQLETEERRLEERKRELKELQDEIQRAETEQAEINQQLIQLQREIEKAQRSNRS